MGFEPLTRDCFQEDSSELSLQDKQIDPEELATKIQEATVAILEEDKVVDEAEEKLLEAIDHSVAAKATAAEERDKQGTNIDTSVLSDSATDLTKGDDSCDRDLVKRNIAFYGKYASLGRAA